MFVEFVATKIFKKNKLFYTKNFKNMKKRIIIAAVAVLMTVGGVFTYTQVKAEAQEADWRGFTPNDPKDPCADKTGNACGIRLPDVTILY